MRVHELSVADGTVVSMEEINEPAAVELTDQHRDMLDFERSWWKYAGAKETAVRARFEMGSTRYYQVLNWVIDQPEAVTIDPLLVRRLQRLRRERQVQRSARRLGFEDEA